MRYADDREVLQANQATQAALLEQYSTLLESKKESYAKHRQTETKRLEGVGLLRRASHTLCALHFFQGNNMNDSESCH